MAQRTGWSVANFALPDAGFVADGQGGHAFTYQVDRAQGANPQVIVIVGGIADTRFPDTGPISVGALDAINKIKLGGERALVVGPTWYRDARTRFGQAGLGGGPEGSRGRRSAVPRCPRPTMADQRSDAARPERDRLTRGNP